MLLLHGSLGSSDDWGYQVEALAAHHTVIVMESRGQGRSTRDARPFSYDLMADDVVALLDALKIDKVDVVGWSDGANIDTVAGDMSRMWATEPNWTDAQLGTIKSPVWIVDGDHEEFIKREHTEHIASAIPGAGLTILPNVSHFAPVQAPALFNAVVLQFLDSEPKKKR